MKERAQAVESPAFLYDLTHPKLDKLVVSWGFNRVHATRIWGYLYREHVASLDMMTGLPPRLLARLFQETWVAQIRVLTETPSSDGNTRKFLLAYPDRQAVETVLMRFTGRITACLSSQIGCALGCVFCATGQMGFTRNLTAGEIVSQAMHVARCSPERLRNIVLMGMGEPLQNYEEVMRSLDILCDPGGLAISPKRVTLSTVGVIPGIIRLADEARPYSLAVSLHAACQEDRVAMMPAARAWPLDDLMEACRYYAAKLDRKIFYEWTLIEGRNDSAEMAHALATLLRGLPAHVNLIPLNPTARYDGIAARWDSVQGFQSILKEHGLPSTVRQRRGLDIAAGCGQLAGLTASATQ